MPLNTTIHKVTACEQLQELFRQAQAEQTPVSLYRQPQSGGIELDFSDWKEIEVFDLDNLMVIVPPGILLKDLNAAAAAKGLRFIPGDTPLLENISIGEWAYRGCPNPSSWKYGAGKHFLLGAAYVLPNGDFTPVGGKCIKNVTGYDFTRFLTGAYADLAVGVQYIIKLMPQPVFRHRFDITIASLASAIELIGKLQARSVPPAWLFWADEQAGSKLFGGQQQGQRIVFELDGNETEVRSYQASLENLLPAGSVQQAPGSLPDLSHLDNETANFWLCDEFKLPYQAVPAFSARFQELRQTHGVTGGLFGQLADGKIHLYLEQTDKAVVRPLITALQQAAKEVGGTVSGKYDRLYGTGTTSPLVAMEVNFKKRIDPGLIYNRKEVG